jgi:PAS domain S-box-containing protein
MPYLLPLVVTGLLSFALAGLAWLRRQVPGAPVFTVLMAVIGEWTVTYAMELASQDLPTKLLFDQLGYLGIVATPDATLAFALHYTAREHWLTSARLAALCVLPASTLLLLWINPTHSLVQSAASVDSSGPYAALVISHGPWFWIHVAYSYALLAIAAALIFGSLLRSPRLYGGQTVAMFIAVAIPLLGNFLHLSRFSPLPRLDLTPFAFAVTGLVLFVAMFRLDFLDLFLGLPLVARQILLAHLPDAVILVDARGTIVDANSFALVVLGQPESRVVGRAVGTIFSDWVDWVREFAEEKPQHVELSFGPPQARRSYDLARAPVYVGEMHLVGWVLVLRDISERKRIEAEREEALAREQAERARAEEAVQLREEFISIAAHELKTPVTSLRLAAETVPRLVGAYQLADNPQARRALQVLDQQSAKLANLVVQLLDLSRLRAGRLSVMRTKVNLADLVRSTVDQAPARTDRHTFALTAPTEAVAFVDAVRFEQVLTNLLDNAIKYSPEGGQIDVTLESLPPASVSLTVRDRGIGIPVDRRDQIFELFYQAHRESHQSGLGIGLFIVRQIVELHGGRVTVEHPRDGGTGFRIVLPLWPHEAVGADDVYQEEMT